MSAKGGWIAAAKSPFRFALCDFDSAVLDLLQPVEDGLPQETVDKSSFTGP
jgi:hypothetical protein